MHIAVVGCAHGELDEIYDTIAECEVRHGVKVEVVLCCGDFQAVRNATDLRAMAIPPRHYAMGTFYKYFSGEKTAPILTIFIGGNHEASNFLAELPYGGWVAPKIYYLGYAGCVRYRGIRIAGLSGIFKGHDYAKGRFDFPPYTGDTMRSNYHHRYLDVFRLKLLAEAQKVRSEVSGGKGAVVDIFMSHDWPRGLPECLRGPSVDFDVECDTRALFVTKPHFEPQVRTNQLGGTPLANILSTLKPRYWLAAHMHVKFPALIHHKVSENGGKRDGNVTKFLCLDKCLPGRSFLQILRVQNGDPGYFENSQGKADLCYDPEWLAILASTESLQRFTDARQDVSKFENIEDGDYIPKKEEIALILDKLSGIAVIPENFTPTAPFHDERDGIWSDKTPLLTVNSQTEDFCAKLGLPDWFDKIKQAGVGAEIIDKPILNL